MRRQTGGYEMTGIRPRGSGVWQLRISLGPDPVKVRADNRPYYRVKSTTFRGTKTQARAERARLQAQWYPEKERTDTTFGDVYLIWIGGADLAGTTRQAHEMLANKHILPALGRIKLRHLTALEIESLYAHLLRPKKEGGAGLAPSSIRRVHAIIGSALKRAVAWGWLDRNPAEAAKAPTIHGRPETHTPTELEMERAFVAAAALSAESGDNVALAFVATAAWTGMRRGELCGLRWEDIDGRNRVIHVRRNVVDVGGRIEVKSPKSGKARIVQIPDQLVAVLAKYEEEVGDRGPWLWSTDKGERVRPDRLTELWGTIRERAGLNEAFRLHDVRHSYGTLLVSKGLLMGASGNMGHGTPDTTMRNYANPGVDAQRLAADAIGRSYVPAVPSP